MRNLTWIALLLIAALPTTAIADDLDITLHDSLTDTEESWTLHDVELGSLPAVTFETGEREGIVIEMEFEDQGEQVGMYFRIYRVTFKKRNGNSPRAIARSRLSGEPRISSMKGTEASVRTGNEEGFLQLSMTYVTTVAEE